MTTTLTIGMADAKSQFSRITADINRTGVPVTVFKNNKPWVEIRPLAVQDDFANLPSATLAAIEEAEAIAENPNRVSYKTASSLFDSLGI